jgi:hypothetical protein
MSVDRQAGWLLAPCHNPDAGQPDQCFIIVAALLKLHFNHIYVLTNYIRLVLLQKVIVTQLIKKYPAFHGTRMFITVCPRAHHWFLSFKDQNTQKFNFTCFIWLRNWASHAKGRTYIEGENRVLRRIFGAKREEEAGGWKRLHNEERHKLYASSNIIRVIRSRRVRWAGHVACMGEMTDSVGTTDSMTAFEIKYPGT